MKWFRLWVDILDDLKILQLSDYEFRMWILLLAHCSEVDAESGQCQGNVKSLSTRFRTQVNHLSRVFETFQRLGLISTSDEGFINITNWNKRQFKSDYAYERVLKYRDRQQEKKRFNVVSRNVSETAPDTDTDTDTDTDKKKIKKEKALFFELPQGIKKETWDAFVLMRKTMKAPLTQYAVNLIIVNLKKLSNNNGSEMELILQQSIANNWRGVFPLQGVDNVRKGKGNSQTGNGIPEYRTEIPIETTESREHGKRILAEIRQRIEKDQIKNG